jgi:hypothetical protein
MDIQSSCVAESNQKEFLAAVTVLPSNVENNSPSTKMIYGPVFSNLESSKTTKRRMARERKCDIFLYFEGETAPFGFVRINSLMSMKVCVLV